MMQYTISARVMVAVAVSTYFPNAYIIEENRRSLQYKVNDCNDCNDCNDYPHTHNNDKSNTNVGIVGNVGNVGIVGNVDIVGGGYSNYQY